MRSLGISAQPANINFITLFLSCLSMESLVGGNKFHKITVLCSGFSVTRSCGKKKLYGLDFFLFRFCFFFVFFFVFFFLLPLKTVLAEALTHTYNLLAMKLRAQPTTPPMEHTHAYKFKHTRIQVHTRIQLQTHTHTSTNTHAYKYKHTRIQVQTHAYKYKHTRIQVQTHAYNYKHTRIQVQTHTYN